MEKELTRNRNKDIKIRFTEDELEKMDNQVKLSGLAREAYIRSILLKSEVPNPIPPESFNTVIYHLRRIGNNMNQLAVIANKTGNIDWNKYKNDYDELNKQILEIRRIVCNGEGDQNRND